MESIFKKILFAHSLYPSFSVIQTKKHPTTLGMSWTFMKKKIKKNNLKNCLETFDALKKNPEIWWIRGKMNISLNECYVLAAQCILHITFIFLLFFLFLFQCKHDRCYFFFKKQHQEKCTNHNQKPETSPVKHILHRMKKKIIWPLIQIFASIYCHYVSGSPLLYERIPSKTSYRSTCFIHNRLI